MTYTTNLLYNMARKRGVSMSEMYLTKVERKTIFTEAVIYVLLMFVISDFTVVGPFWFNFIPWLLLIGIIGSYKLINPIVTTLICAFTSFVSALIKTEGFNVNVVLITIVSTISVVLGVIIGKCIHQFILAHRLVKFLPMRERFLLVLIILISITVSVGSNAYVYGDAFSYGISLNNFNKYMDKTYLGISYKYTGAVYNRSVYGKYIHKVNSSEFDITFLAKSKSIYVDMQIEERTQKLNEDLTNKYIDTLSADITNSCKYIKVEDLSLRYDYSKVGILPDYISLYITTQSDSDEVYAEVIKAINLVNEEDLSSIASLGQVVLKVGDKVININREDLNNLSVEYIKEGINIEQLDEAY